MTDHKAIERCRQKQQVRLDAEKGQAERNQLGQFATPPQLANEISKYVQKLWKKRTDEIRFLDPAIGTGSFYSALLSTFLPEEVELASGVEVDRRFAAAASSLWGGTGLEVTRADFTKLDPPQDEDRYNLVLTNPPYVRHHHLCQEDKKRLKSRISCELHLDVSGLAGLYAYFLLLSHAWMTDGGIGVWLLPSEFMDVNYGKAIKEYLTRHVRLLHIHRFQPSDVQFCDALVTSAIVVFQKHKPTRRARPLFTLGGSILKAQARATVSLEDLERARKWTVFPGERTHVSTSSEEGVTLGDLFKIKRGIATGANSFFIIPLKQAIDRAIPAEAIRPILPSPRLIEVSTIEADKNGWPRVEPQLALIDTALPEKDIQKAHPALWEYLKLGLDQHIHEGYLASRRTPWYSQEQRDPAPFLCTYMGRSGPSGTKPFRFIWNKSRAIAPNVYLMLYPKGCLKQALEAQPGLCRRVLTGLEEIGLQELVENGRVYGGGLHKVEPKELAAISADTVLEQIGSLRPERQMTLSL